MKLTVNGQAREIPPGLSIAGLLEHLTLHSPRVAVELNRCLVPRAEHPTRALTEGDTVEIVTFVGGG